MWLFTRLGFFSIGIANRSNGSPDPTRVMIRARDKAHLIALRDRFPALRGRILTRPLQDYRYRLIADKRQWALCVAALAREQTWSNFKNEAKRFRPQDAAYLDALHEIWRVMYRLQNPPPPPPPQLDFAGLGEEDIDDGEWWQPGIDQ